MFFDIEVYSICICLAEKVVDDILPEFWKIYEKETVICWEPHWMPREYVRKFAHWLDCDDVKGNTIIMVRNRYIVAGSSIRGNLKDIIGSGKLSKTIELSA
ncbi:MAG: hypothetical protein HFH75_09250 [Lachnospiraceae bacterium]|nr:hypothetical protein [Lachnospiraceae bacterium]